MAKDFPSSGELETALLQVLCANLQGLTVQEIEVQVGDLLKISPESLQMKRPDGRSEFGYRLAWARTHAKQKGFVKNLRFSTWLISEAGLTEVQ